MWWVKTCLYLCWITLLATWAVLPWGPARTTHHWSKVTTGGNWSNRRKPEMFGRVQLHRTLLTGDQDNFNQTTAWRRNGTLVRIVRDTYTTTGSPRHLKRDDKLDEKDAKSAKYSFKPQVRDRTTTLRILAIYAAICQLPNNARWREIVDEFYNYMKRVILH